MAASQHYIQLVLPASRGQIIDSDGNPLVLNQPAYLVYASPKLIKNIDDFSFLVGKILKIEPKDLADLLKTPGRVWIPLFHKVELDTVDKLKSLNLAGLGFEKEPKRYYPEASMAAQLIGFVGSDQNGNDQGYFGLEGLYDRELRGQDGSLRMEKDAKGAPILVGETTRIDPENGRNLNLYLDRSIQYFVETRLAEGIQKYGAIDGNVIVLDPKTGGILAMASFPRYDPGNFVIYPKEDYKNPIVASAFEPGSTFKVLVMAAALNENLIKPDTKVDESGPVKIGEYAIKTWNEQYHGIITMTQVLEYSSNVGMVFVEKKLGKEKMLDYIRKFGFGEITNIDLQDESSPDLRPDRDWGEIDLATASFGQGIAVTPIQMVRAVGAIANGGILVKPQVVKEIIDDKGKRTIFNPKEIREVVSQNTAKIMTEMMVNAVDLGEAKWAKPKGYRIAGKTGTAQIPVAGHYDATKTIASFIGFAPADDPKFVMLVTLREPKSSPWGSETAAPLFFAIARDIFNNKGITPSP